MKKHVFFIIVLLIISIIIFKGFLPIRTPARIALHEMELRIIYQKISEFMEKNEGRFPDVTTTRGIIANTTQDAKYYEVNKALNSGGISPASKTWLVREKPFSHRVGRKRYLYKTRIVLMSDGTIVSEKKLSFSLKEFILNRAIF